MDTEKGVRVRLGEEALLIIKKLSKATGQPMEKVLAQAVGFYFWAFRECSNGAKIGSIIKTEDGEDLVQFIKFNFIKEEEEKEETSSSDIKIYN